MTKWVAKKTFMPTVNGQIQYEISPVDLIIDNKTSQKYDGIVQVFGTKLANAVAKALNDANINPDDDYDEDALLTAPSRELQK